MQFTQHTFTDTGEMNRSVVVFKCFADHMFPEDSIHRKSLTIYGKKCAMKIFDIWGYEIPERRDPVVVFCGIC